MHSILMIFLIHPKHIPQLHCCRWENSFSHLSDFFHADKQQNKRWNWVNLSAVAHYLLINMYMWETGKHLKTMSFEQESNCFSFNAVSPSVCAELHVSFHTWNVNSFNTHCIQTSTAFMESEQCSYYFYSVYAYHYSIKKLTERKYTST